jgi:hypothetical protein
MSSARKRRWITQRYRVQRDNTRKFRGKKDGWWVGPVTKIKTPRKEGN